MDWRSHAAIGALLSALAFYFIMHLPAESIALLSIFAGFSALLPDIDHKMSKIRSISDKAFVVFALIYAYFSCRNCGMLEIGKNVLILIAIYFLVITFAKPRHRGITHSFAASLVFGVLLYLLLDRNIAVAGFIGYLSHLIADKEIKMI